MNREKKVIIYKNTYDVSQVNDIYTLPANQQEFEFELPTNYEYYYNKTILDGDSFRVYVEYSNESGSRTERKELVPELIL